MMLRQAALPPDREWRAFVLEMEARFERCGACETGYLCYRACCFPPKGYDGALHGDWCHDCLHGMYESKPRPKRQKPCPTCGQAWPAP